ncbi:OLC1v1024379C1 [Oldenlandia corymbosa var. corymbosa]|uniref:OLC1v1024379C1 n=1 Tax=Oldenlandia corymbosa var. corymbosa TaxID=529605 RepID=A0AAV1C5M9_OLDCO|nr:OLC1v1024379C1 [Oldenlandia corymbosa var. corymbosa]
MNDFSNNYPSPSPSPSPAGDRGTLSTATPPVNCSSRHCCRLGGARHHRHVTNNAVTGAKRRTLEDELYGDPVKCTGKSCKSCTAGVIADCVAVCCCCPCSVVNIMVFTFLKVPWMVGRRILRLGRKRRRKQKCLRAAGEEEDQESGSGAATADDPEEMSGGISRKGRSSFTLSFPSTLTSSSRSRGLDWTGALPEFQLPGDEYYEELKDRPGDQDGAWFEAEQQVWFELHQHHQIGHLGFGRVSFTGIPIPCN